MLEHIRLTICTIGGVVGGVIVTQLGGWDKWLETLVLFMILDYITGLIVAGVFHNSTKTESGALESRAGWKGICRKCGILLAVLVACRLDLLLGITYTRSAVIVGFIINETISIMENLGLMGLPFPDAIQKAIELLSNDYKTKMTKLDTKEENPEQED